MSKSSGNSISALRKAFNFTGATKFLPSSELTTLKDLVPKPRGSSPTSPSSSSAPAVDPKRDISGFAEKFALHLKKASARNSKKSLVPAEESSASVTREISAIIPCSDDLASAASQFSLGEPFQNQFLNGVDQRKKEIYRLRKQKITTKNLPSRYFLKLLERSADKLDAESILGIFRGVGREKTLKEYKALIILLIEKARNSDDRDSLESIEKVYQLFAYMRERGFEILEDTYGPFLVYLIHTRMKEEFIAFSEFIKDYDPQSYTRLGYYEMLLSIIIGDESKIKELCSDIAADGGNSDNKLAESYLLALCQNDMKEQVIQLLENFDMSNILTLEHASYFFESFQRLQLENYMEKFILALKMRGAEEGSVSSFIYDYATSMHNLAVEDIVSKFEKLHEKVEVVPTIASWDKLIKLFSSLSKIQVALDIAGSMCKSGLSVSIESFHPILHACEQTSEFELVHQIYSVIRQHNLKPRGDTFKIMIILCLKMKDFEGAYNLLNDAMEMKVIPTAGMYNAVMAGYFREKNNHGALKVLQQMEDLNIEPDSETYSYLIINCSNETDVVKYHNEMKHAGHLTSKYVCMALINAFANLGNFKMAKQVLQDAQIPYRYVNQVRSVLVSALSTNGQISEALHEYDEIKQAGNIIEPKAAISLIEHLQAEGNLERLQQLLDELKDSSYWFDGCSRVVLYCVRHNIASSAVDLLKKLKEKDESSTYMVIDQVFSEIWEMEHTNLPIGLELIRAIKEELNLRVSRISLDFLLSTCVKAKDPNRAQLVWSEYENAGLPPNILTFLRMYQALLATGDHKAASKILHRMKSDDPHVCYVIESCKETYSKRYLEKGKKNK